ncbi:C2 domain-containing protein At1g53590 isoform X2 [Selaginella moellendorffii]|uniref:C2 domain-containing protein At1g53590 isoform X2 n=1 Tax=Selaginella moellendorffii TaxID=88036 RepID=UPI000D1C3150|nr:C2 domain-containing protein At1g53590 isoform X2 [Selaginella moellendorffii]|eukprot:XP_024532167.1 C2 domain-containing protein At1g53590 isoform X2 [Selaginella moellendorffii]
MDELPQRLRAPERAGESGQSGERIWAFASQGERQVRHPLKHVTRDLKWKLFSSKSSRFPLQNIPVLRICSDKCREYSLESFSVRGNARHDLLTRFPMGEDREQGKAAGVADKGDGTPTFGMQEFSGEETLGSAAMGDRGAESEARGGDSSSGSSGDGARMDQVFHWLLHWPFILHAALVLVVVWILSLLGINHAIVPVVGFIFLFHIERRHREKWLRRIRHEERKHAFQKQLLSDFESVRWLNETLARAWPVFLEKFASQDFLAPLMPFFLAKYKPWTVQDGVLQSFALGRNPPMFAGMRALDPSGTDDDVVFETTMEFVAADDMSAVLSVQLRKRLGGLWTKLHISKLHIEGKVRLGVRFHGGWPFVSRLRISFESAPYVQIEARPLSTYGMDMAELPGIASWLDTMLMDALEDSVVKPNMLVINVEKIANSWATSEYATLPSAESAPPVAVAVVEILEATQLKPADVNGLADPFVKGVLNTNRFKTSIKWKTLNPKWREVFRLPIRSWEIQNRMMFHVRDKDLFRDDNLGYCDVLLAKFRGGDRHEVCLPLKGVKTGRITFAITVEEAPDCQLEVEVSPSTRLTTDGDESLPDSLGLDHYEIIDTGVSASGIFSIMRPGKAVQKKWRGRKGRKLDEDVELPDNTLFSGSLERESESSDSEGDKSGQPGGKARFWKWSHRGPRDKKLVSGELVSISEKGGQMKLRTVIDTDSAVTSPAPAPEDSTPALSLPDKAAAKPSDVRTDLTPISSGVQTGTNSQVPTPKLAEDSMRASDGLDDAESQEVSPGRRSMRIRDRARGVVKQAERTASHIGHSLFGRRSGKDLVATPRSDNAEPEQQQGVCSPERSSATTPTSDQHSN